MTCFRNSAIQFWRNATVHLSCRNIFARCRSPCAHRDEQPKSQCLDGSSGGLHTVHKRAATDLHGAPQIALIQLIGGFLAAQGAFEIKMAIVNIATQEDLPDALALAAGSMKRLLLGEPNRRVRSSDTEDTRMAHCSPIDSHERSG